MENKNDEKIVIGSEVGKKVNCSMCNKEGTTDEFITTQSHKGENFYLCAECRTKTNDVFEAETKSPNIVPGIILGVIGAIIGGVIWYFVTISTQREIGYISLGLGYLVGNGVYFGSGKKRGPMLQAISAVIAFLAIFITEKFIFDHFLNQYIQANQDQFPDTLGQVFSISFFSPDFLMSLVSPIGLLIYAIGIYVAYNVCKAKKI